MTDEWKGPSHNVQSNGVDGTVRSQYDWTSTFPSTAVVETLAVALDREATTLDPLYESIDPDALDTLIRPDGSLKNTGDTAVSFTISDRRVTVYSRGDVIIGPNPRRR